MLCARQRRRQPIGCDRKPRGTVKHVSDARRRDFDTDGISDVHEGFMLQFANDEPADATPLSHSMVTRLGRKLTAVRTTGGRVPTVRLESRSQSF